MGIEDLRVAYSDLSNLALTLDEETSWRPTACLGWAARDLVAHVLSDAQRALVALSTPAIGPADKDAVTYWLDSPGRPDPESRGIRATRTIASQWRLEYLVATFAETTAAVLTLAGRTPINDLVSTQGHVLCVEDLMSTLVVEATIHQLDLTAGFDDQPGPQTGPLGITRITLDGLLGATTPAEWDSSQWVRASTGRAELTSAQAQYLGVAGRSRLPLLR